MTNLAPGQVWKCVDRKAYIRIVRVTDGTPYALTCDKHGRTTRNFERPIAYWRFALQRGARYGADFILLRED